ncbi:MAG: acyltransferase [Alphaproteobacteria bacterium]|nr:acyltransferase [Alphaproteobacteria bacterium]
MNKESYDTLDILRGFSALFVIVYHYYVYFFTQPEISANLLEIEPIYLPDPFYLQPLLSIPIDIGHLGVAFFFLISGFLIQPSLERYSSLKTFLIHKIFRLWPSYVFCFSLGLVFVALFYFFKNDPFPYSFGQILSYFFWVRDIFNYPMIDGAIWTLELQIKFYIFAAIVWSFGKKNFTEKICYLVLFLSVAVYGLYLFGKGEESSWFYFVVLARKTLKYFLLILLGTCIYSYYKKELSGVKTLFLCSLLVICFISPLFSSPSYPKTVSYLLGFFSFAYLALYHGKSKLKEGILRKTIKWVSSISYPLYIGHVLPGYTLMFFMFDQGISVFWGSFMALFYVFLMSYFVHEKIELVFIKLNKKMSIKKIENP